MKKIIIGSLIGTLIFFAYQTAMWMGGFHKDFTEYTSQQESIMADLGKYQLKDGLYMMPIADPNSPDIDKAREERMKANMGKPWAMLFYHPSMNGMDPIYIVNGVLYSLVACLIASFILYRGRFRSFSSRFFVSMGLAIFTLAQGVLDDMNWWSFPWSFIKPQVVDLTLGWGICSLWLAYFVKNTSSPTGR